MRSVAKATSFLSLMALSCLSVAWSCWIARWMGLPFLSLSHFGCGVSSATPALLIGMTSMGYKYMPLRTSRARANGLRSVARSFGPLFLKDFTRSFRRCVSLCWKKNDIALRAVYLNMHFEQIVWLSKICFFFRPHLHPIGYKQVLNTLASGQDFEMVWCSFLCNEEWWWGWAISLSQGFVPVILAHCKGWNVDSSQAARPLSYELEPWNNVLKKLNRILIYT